MRLRFCQRCLLKLNILFILTQSERDMLSRVDKFIHSNIKALLAMNQSGASTNSPPLR